MISIQHLLSMIGEKLRNLKSQYRGETRIQLTSKEIIKRYQDGHRNFKNILISNQSFSGIDLSGSDFTNSEFWGCDFNGAILKGTKFNKATFKFNIWQIISISTDGIENRNHVIVSLTTIYLVTLFYLLALWLC
ncbi:pentapeptide repeat-containing protein [bacterium]|nr:pentapeptide repeat-containing protein [bacterium]